jgi:hypothetical protein
MKRALASGLSLLGLALIGCSGEAPPPATVTAPPAATIGVVAQAPVATASATAAPAPTAPARTRVDMSKALARLPKNAAVYGFFRPVAADTLVDWSRAPEQARREFSRIVPSGTFLELVATLGIDPAVPVAFAVVGPELAESRKLVDGLIAGSKPTNIKADTVQIALAAAAPNGLFVRPLTSQLSGADTATELARVAERARVPFVRCPDAPLCAQFGSDKPLGVIERGSTLFAVYKQGATLEFDWLETSLGSEATRAKALGDRRTLSGGPTGSCGKLDSEADLSFCVDGTRASELGAATGLQKTAVAVKGVAPDMRGKILLQGKKESLVNLTLATPKRRLVEDGTLSVIIAKSGYAAAGTWQLTEASMASVQAALARESCASGDKWIEQLLPVLQKGFGDVGADFKDLARRSEDFQDAGFGAALTAFARIWPNMLEAVPAGFGIRPLVIDRFCARAASDRLELRIEGPAVDVDRL